MHTWLAVAALAAIEPAAAPTAKVGGIDLFGAGGADVAAVRAALLPLVGTSFVQDESGRRSLQTEIARRVEAATGHPPTDVTSVCCDDRRDAIVYVGLPGASAVPPVDARPTGSASLPRSLVRASEAVEQALVAAVRAGRAGEERDAGYALGVDPELRRQQLQFRDQAIAAQDRLYEVLATSRDDAARALAAQALGYVPPSERQIDALVRAVRDPAEATRNNAVRALGVLADSKQPLGRTIPADPFVTLMRSSRWTDRNKGLLILSTLSAARSPALLDRLRRECLADLVDMARWHWRGHADPARVLLGRVAGLPEHRIAELMEREEVEALITAAAR